MGQEQKLMVIVCLILKPKQPFLPSASLMVSGSPSDATVNFRMTLLDPTAIRYLLFQEYASDVRPVVSAEAC